MLTDLLTRGLEAAKKTCERPCSHCNGTGTVEDYSTAEDKPQVTCFLCEGAGHHTMPLYDQMTWVCCEAFMTMMQLKEAGQFTAAWDFGDAAHALWQDLRQRYFDSLDDEARADVLKGVTTYVDNIHESLEGAPQSAVEAGIQPDELEAILATPLDEDTHEDLRSHTAEDTDHADD